ncbi:MAG TPA: thiamine-phosphate kinase [Steroidobacteraceae bacterium]|nr:thiamine-phosphate kinase [Steroidobacteraceae bacterium]
MDEFELIRRYFGSLGAAREDVLLGVGDDAALLRMPADADLAASVDTLVAGRHFPPQSDARSIGHRAMAVNLSDLAAMGATPAWATLALTLPGADADWLERFSSGFAQLAAAHGVALVGGDTTAGPLSVTVQIMGHVHRGTALRRGGGREGDLLAVSGTLGDAAAGLALATGALAAQDAACAAELRSRFEYPTPRVELGIAARGIASAAMDLSDGLAGDLPKLAAASGLGARIDVGRLPLSRALQSLAHPDQARDFALGGGDDYELLLAVPPRRFEALAARARELNLTLSAIGELRRGNALEWTLGAAPFVPRVQGYAHFR